jgi:hypothetical protein
MEMFGENILQILQMDALMDKVKEKKPRRTIKVRLDPEPPMPVEAVRPAEPPKPKELERPLEKQEPKIIREYYTTIREVPKVVTKVIRKRAAPKKRKARKPKK